jgi:CubicO group peptidase (beta-lactamase class C family)
MSITKSVTSALTGIANDRGLIPGEHATVAELVPREYFESDSDVERFRAITLRHLRGMSALDAPVPPGANSPEAIARSLAAYNAPNRMRFALTQKLLSSPGESFQYTDVTPALTSGILQLAAKTSLLDFANAHLFGPLGFKNHEWLHQDGEGFDLGGFGLRLRPIDMQKFGALYLGGGAWGDQQLIAKRWTTQSFEPWIGGHGSRTPNYGWHWWGWNIGTAWESHVANGWKGQRVAVFPTQGLVVTMTACIDDGNEAKVFSTLLQEFVIPATGANSPRAVSSADEAAARRLAELNENVRVATSFVADDVEPRMVPSVATIGTRVPFAPGP